MGKCALIQALPFLLFVTSASSAVKGFGCGFATLLFSRMACGKGFGLGKHLLGLLAVRAFRFFVQVGLEFGHGFSVIVQRQQSMGPHQMDQRILCGSKRLRAI